MSDVSTPTAELSPGDRRRQLEALLRKKAEKARSFPLSFAQQRLWILDRLDPGSPVYNVPLAMKIDGPLDADALHRTLNEVIARHESLRTRFVVVDEQPKQVVEPVRLHKLNIVDLSYIEPEDRQPEAVSRAEAEARKSFRLDEAPLFRALLMRFSATEHVLVVVLHHIISDDWSMAVLFREVATLYQAFRDGRPSPLEPLPVQYADYTVWQQKRLQGETLDKLLGYWRDKLSGVTPLELPGDPSRAVQLQPSGIEELQLSPAIVDKLRELGRREHLPRVAACRDQADRNAGVA